jgi:hypothetical protein
VNAPAINMAPCWAWETVLAGGADPGLVPLTAACEALEYGDCDEPHAYEVWLDKTIWDLGHTLLCVEHTAKIRALRHGGIVRVKTTSAGAR